MNRRITRRDLLIAGASGATGAITGFVFKDKTEDIEKLGLKSELMLTRGQLTAKAGELALKAGQHNLEVLRLQGELTQSKLLSHAELTKERLLRQVEEALYAPLAGGTIDFVITAALNVIREEHRLEAGAIDSIRQAIELVRNSISLFFDALDSPMHGLSMALNDLEVLVNKYVELTQEAKELRHRVLDVFDPITHILTSVGRLVVEHDPTDLTRKLIEFVSRTGYVLEEFPEQFRASILRLTSAIKTHFLSEETSLKSKVFVPLEREVFYRVLAYLDLRTRAIEDLEKVQLRDLNTVIKTRHEVLRRIENYQAKQNELSEYIIKQVVSGEQAPTVEELLRLIN